jgi:hypothetical protein
MPSVAGCVPVLLPRRGAAGRASVLLEETAASELLSAYTVASAWLCVPCRAGMLACKKYGGDVTSLMLTRADGSPTKKIRHSDSHMSRMCY